MIKYLILFIAISISFSSFSQKQFFKFGKVSEEELKLKKCPFEEDADAMILGESGILTFNYHNDKGWQYYLTVTRRIKIFNKEGLDEANIKITLYDPKTGSSREEVGNIKAFTYNLVNGKVEKTKLTNSEEYETRISDYRIEKSFAMPNVKEGSVIEYKYDLASDFIVNLYSWHFQNEIPTAISDFIYTIPEFFYYQSNQVGNYIHLEREETKFSETFTYQYITGYGGNEERRTGTMTSLSTRTRFTGRNIPAVFDEPYMNNKPDVPTRLEFQLMSIRMPNSTPKQIASNYVEFNKTLQDGSSFGGAIKKGNFAKDKISTLSGTDTERAAEIYKWLANSLAWTEVYSTHSDDAGRKTFNDGKGSTGDINLTLVAAYREAGLRAYPVILSTRGHGVPHPTYPNAEDFNYVIAAVQTDDGLYLSDATTTLPFGMLPTRCLNNKGWISMENGGKWVDLKANAKESITAMNVINIEVDELVANFEVRYDGYARLRQEHKLNKDGESAFEEELVSDFPDSDVSDVSVQKDEDHFKVQFTTSKPIDDESILYLQPILYGGINENPFKREKRYSVVDYYASPEYQVITKITVPEGYTAELPESISIGLPEGAGKFIYSINQLGNTINVMSSFQLKKLDFAPSEYPNLKEFYEMMVEKNKEMIVLKKS